MSLLAATKVPFLVRIIAPGTTEAEDDEIAGDGFAEISDGSAAVDTVVLVDVVGWELDAIRVVAAAARDSVVVRLLGGRYLLDLRTRDRPDDWKVTPFIRTSLDTEVGR